MTTEIVVDVSGQVPENVMADLWIAMEALEGP